MIAAINVRTALWGWFSEIKSFDGKDLSSFSVDSVVEVSNHNSPMI